MTDLSFFEDHCKRMFAKHAERIERADGEADRLEGERRGAVLTLTRVEAERDALKREIDALAPRLTEAQLTDDAEKIAALRETHARLVRRREELRQEGLGACDRLDAVPPETAIRSRRSGEIARARGDADDLAKALHRIVDEARQGAGFPTVEQKRLSSAALAAEVVATRPVAPPSMSAPISDGGEARR